MGVFNADKESKMKRFLSTVLIYFFGFHSIAAIAETIRFGVIDFYPPFAFSTNTGYIHGFDIDVAKAVCQQLNTTCSFTPMSLQNLFISVNQGKVDAIIGAISITPQRQRDFSFTQPYYKSTMSFVTLSAKQLDVTNLQGKKIGVEKASIFYVYMTQHYGKRLTVIAYNTNQEMITALSEHKVDAVLLDSPAANFWVKYSTGLFKVIGAPVQLTFDQGYGIGVKKGNEVLRNSINNALTGVIKDGTLKKLQNTYFGINGPS